jgi:Fe-S-cluster-containing hydrogenase component 2
MTTRKLKSGDLQFFRRTSTHEVLDLIYEGRDTFEKIKVGMFERSHRRKDHDIRYMIRALERIGLIEDHMPTEFGDKVAAFMKLNKSYTTHASNSAIQEMLKINGSEILKEFYKKGFLLVPFLNAVLEPATNQIIAARFFIEAEKAGVYGLNAETDYNDFVPAMKNFAIYLGFAERGPSRGRIILTDLTKSILDIHSETILERQKCDTEICRKICPAVAIRHDHIEGCVNCGLCARCCPYGGVICNSSEVQFDFSICGTHLTNHISSIQPTYICRLQPNLQEIIGSEINMQRWIVSLLKICKIKAIVPGPGEKPDIAINRNQNSCIVECKNNPITSKRLNKLEAQLVRYMDPSNLRNLSEDLHQTWQFDLLQPDVFIVAAPEKSDVPYILDSIASQLDFPLSFLSTESIFQLHNATLKNSFPTAAEILKIFSQKSIDLSPLIIEAIH